MPIYERKRKDGTTVYDVREYIGFTIEGKRDQASCVCYTMREARAKQAEFRALRSAKRNKSGRCTFGTYVDRWWWPSTADLSPTSKDTYRRELDKRLLPAFEKVDIRDIDRPAIQKMVDKCPTEAVARKAVSVLKTILNEAKGDGLIDSNPATARYKMPPKGKKRDNGLVITRFEDMRPLMRALDAYGSGTLEKLAVTGLYMGMRPEERYALDTASIDVRSRTVSVEHAFVTASKRHGGNQMKGTKTELSTRILPMPSHTVPRFERLLEGLEDGPFILGAYGGRISPSTAQKKWGRFLAWCGKNGFDVPQVTLENMRHSYATSFLHAGGNVEDLSRLLGHSDINTTYRKYVKPNVDDLHRAIGGIDME